ncbi:MAG TPA: PP2C family protein-serine/threonine phosphatase [Phycisphaerales bacterium]|nr:PP2C family protein-serine/threonine phosphatase [Phycisphaerales bacterium]
MPAEIDPSTEGSGTTGMPDVHAIACMEVWGGSQAIDAAVSVPGNDVHVRSVPYQGAAAGGDIYYVSNCAAGIITRFFLADVSSHGQDVAHIASELRALMRRHINTADQSRFAVALNRAFAALDLAGRFATAVLVTYFAPTDHVIVCNAGHPRPLLYRAACDRWELLDASTPDILASRQHGKEGVGIANLPLGILDPTEYQQLALRLEPDDLVVLYTDALIEATGADGRQLGEAGLLGLARALTTAERCGAAAAALHRRTLEHTGGSELDDDATVIVLHHNGVDPPPGRGIAGRLTTFAHMLGLGAVDSGPGMKS